MEKVSLDFKSASTGKTTSNVHIRVACSCGPADSYLTAGGGVSRTVNREGGNQWSDESKKAENKWLTSNATMLRVVVLKNCRCSYLSFANMLCSRKVKRGENEENVRCGWGMMRVTKGVVVKFIWKWEQT